MTLGRTSDVLVQKYDSSQAGARVGWSEVYSDGEYPTQVRGAIATVGEDGATVSVCENRNVYHNSLVSGMFEACSWAIYLKADQPVSEEHMMHYVEDDALYQMHGGGFRPAVDVKSDTVKWGVGNEIMTNIREDLDSIGQSASYPTVYFAINALIGRSRQNFKSGYVSQEMLSSMVLADPSMSAHTDDEIGKAEEYHVQLWARSSNNSTIIRKLESPSVAPRVVADEFDKSREIARALYESQLIISKQMLWRKAVHLPEGHQRTWPYMDVAVNDERSYGIELQALRANNGQKALSELQREERELESGRWFSQSGINTLRALRVAEQ